MLLPFVSGVSPLWALTNAFARQALGQRVSSLPFAVISVGNVVAGGVGKTEVTAWLARTLSDRGNRVAIAMAGYGARMAPPREGLLYRNYQEAQAGGASDEVLVHLLRNPQVPVIMARRRDYGIKHHGTALKPDVIILDDGLQHFYQHRHWDVIVHDFSLQYPIFRDFPALFEGANRSLIAMGTAPIPSKWAHLPWIHAHYQLIGTTPLNSIDQVKKSTDAASNRHKRVLLVSGIGNPHRFTDLIKKAGFDVVDHMIFADHKNYTQNDVDKMQARAQELGRDVRVLTTLKDAVKLCDGSLNISVEMLVAHVELVIADGGRQLTDDLLSKRLIA
jgi:tetraacyldisaccharide 4'-kinase